MVRLKSSHLVVCAALAILYAVPAAAQDSLAELWRFDRVDRIGGHQAIVLGRPKVIETPAGKAVQFNGIDDALILNVHPLAGAETFTWEVVFRPDPGGVPEQRFFHLQEQDPNADSPVPLGQTPAPGMDTSTRMLMEIRIIDGKWCLDSVAWSGGAEKALLNRQRLHPFGAWYHVAAVYDGHEFRNYVDGLLEGSAEIHLAPQGRGRSSVGARINRVNYFKGAILLARMTPRPVSPVEFLKLPGDMNSRTGTSLPPNDWDNQEHRAGAIVADGLSAAANHPEDAKEVLATMEALKQANLAKDIPTLDRLYHDDLTFGHSNGWTETKAEVLAIFKQNKETWDSIDFSNSTIRIYGSVALFKGTCDVRSGPPGQIRPHHLDILWVLVKGPRGWQIVARQATTLVVP
jgi:ketosteroid isomerase-like protein